MKRLISLTFICLLLVVTFPVKGQSQSLVERVDRICEQLPSRAENINSRLIKNTKKVSDAKASVNSKLDDRKQNLNEKIENLRNNSEELRFEAYKKLRDSAGSDSEKLTVEVYISSMERAVSDRQTAYDSSISNFNQSVKNAYSSTISVLDTAVQTFTSSIDSIILETQNSCSGEVQQSTIRQQFVNNLKDARLRYVEDIKPTQKLNFDEIKQTRNDSIKKSRTDFEKKVQELNNNLKIGLEN